MAACACTERPKQTLTRNHNHKHNPVEPSQNHGAWSEYVKEFSLFMACERKTRVDKLIEERPMLVAEVEIAIHNI